MVNHIFSGSGAIYDEEKYWTYGCHCMLLGDRPLSSMGHGIPVDGLDKACQIYKECQKCVREKYGPECIGIYIL